MSRPRQVAGLSAACGSAISVSDPCRRRCLRRNLERSPADPTQLLCRAIMALLLLLPSVWPARADDPVGGLAEAPLSLPAGPAQGLVFLFSAKLGPTQRFRPRPPGSPPGCCGRHRGSARLSAPGRCHAERRLPLSRGRDRGREPQDPEPARPGTLLLPDRRGHRLGRHVGAAGPGPGSGRHPGRSCQRRLRHRAADRSALVPGCRGNADRRWLQLCSDHALAGLRPRRRGPERAGRGSRLAHPLRPAAGDGLGQRSCRTPGGPAGGPARGADPCPAGGDHGPWPTADHRAAGGATRAADGRRAVG